MEDDKKDELIIEEETCCEGPCGILKVKKEMRIKDSIKKTNTLKE